MYPKISQRSKGLQKMILKYRFWVMGVFLTAVLGWYFVTDPDGGAETMARIQWLVWLVVVSGPVYLLRRALMDGARSQEAYRQAMRSPMGAGLVFLGLCLLTGLLFLAFTSMARASVPPARSLAYLPVLQEEITNHWPGSPGRAVFAGQVEQETCPSLTSAKCWSPREELKTAREYGFGLGQLTVTSRFDNFAAARGLHPSLREWKWDDRYDARRQIRALVLMDRGHYQRLPSVQNSRERMAMTLSAYNGGMGGLLADRRLCATIPGCDPDRWFGHVEIHSLKNKVAARGYGKSFFEINREYPVKILGVRRSHYVAWFGEG